MDLLHVKRVYKSYASHKALHNVSIHIPEQSVFGLLGPNGAGKTSLIRIINQITAPDKGEVFFEKEKLSPKHISQIGYLPEERGLYKKMKVGEQALYLAQLKGMSKSEAKVKLQNWFEKFDIAPWWDKKVEELSKGMAQKVQFITTVLHEPKLLILDEPFSGFDPVNANLIKDEILELRDKGATILFSTHRMESVEEMCDYIALIHMGRKIIDGEVTEVKKTYRTNCYEVGITSTNILALEEQLKANYKYRQAHFKSLEQMLKCTIEIESNETSSLLSYLMQHGEVHHFKEVIPSINDIFIQNVTDYATA
jgi:ABC-2 type transport system ATP-binding protein